MNIIAISYQNIWPFENKTITINFKRWKYLIKSAIWTGKSFLFFDWPLFGIYKYSNRVVLNRKSKDGFINTFLESENEYYFVSRYITATKSWWDSTKSRLFKINNVSEESLIKFNQSFLGIVNTNIDLSQKIKQFFDIEEILFKSDNELQNTLEDILPPKEVFLSTNFLMQDSDNIFEMTPADRINVFKNIFGLLNIDEAKDIVSEYRKHVQLNLKIKKDTSNFDSKLKEIIINIVRNYDYINSNPQDNSKFDWFDKILNMSFFEDLKLIGEKINILNFDISNIDLQIFEKTLNSIESFKAKYQETKWKIDNKKSIFQELNISKDELNKKKYWFDKDIKEITEFLDNLQSNNLDQIKKDKFKIIDKQNQILQNIDFENIKKHGYEAKNFRDAVNVINSLTEKWKTLKSEISNIDLKISSIQDKQQNLVNQLTNISNKIQVFQDDIKQQTHYFCQQINGNCPYVWEIRWQTQQAINKQLEILQQEKKSLQTEITWLNSENQIKVFENEKGEILKQFENIKQFFLEVNWKLIKDNETKYKNFEAEIREKDQKINEFEVQIQKIDESKKTLVLLQSKLEATDEQIKQKTDEITKIQIEIKENQNLIETYNIEKILYLQKNIENIKNDIIKINWLIKDFKDIQFEIQKLQEEETVLNWLYQVLSKEFMLVVLQDFLPVLSDAINNYLTQIVDYELNFDLIKKSTDKLELDIIINDEKWQRQVKSLSGWQKTVLKLVWILAVSIVIKNDFLFLDETINNLDIESITKVAETIENFVKLKDIKFYVITHSKTIQDMNIWDGIIELDKLS